MKEKKSNESRRKLLKSIAAGSGAIVAGKSLPENWSHPVVDSVMLPAHAQTSCTPSPRTVELMPFGFDGCSPVVFGPLLDPAPSIAELSVTVATQVDSNCQYTYAGFTRHPLGLFAQYSFSYPCGGRSDPGLSWPLYLASDACPPP